MAKRIFAAFFILEILCLGATFSFCADQPAAALQKITPPGRLEYTPILPSSRSSQIAPARQRPGHAYWRRMDFSRPQTALRTACVGFYNPAALAMFESVAQGGQPNYRFECVPDAQGIPVWILVTRWNHIPGAQLQDDGPYARFYTLTIPLSSDISARLLAVLCNELNASAKNAGSSGMDGTTYYAACCAEDGSLIRATTWSPRVYNPARMVKLFEHLRNQAFGSNVMEPEASKVFVENLLETLESGQNAP